MAEYWKSQPKKLCEFCKCWITDNKASVEFHERGKKHKENVQKRIEEVQKKGKEVSQAQKQLKMDLAAIEAAALKAYQKDLNIEPSKSKAESTSESTINTQTNETCSKGESTAGCFISYEGSQPTMQCTHGWNIGQAPEGYYYYYNTTTQASQWESPSCLSSPAPENTRNSTEHRAASEDERKTASEEQQQTSAQKDEKESKEKDTKPKEVKSSPYGQWTAVQTFEPPPPQTQKTESSKEIDTKQDTTAEVVKTEVKFKERSTPKITFRTGGEGNEITFKKRKLNPDKKRNIRQTDPNKAS
ncbi:hypothetical protein ACROYT_G017662 [Oculina patagonica]